MIRVATHKTPDGFHIKIGRRSYHVRTSDEADAFMAGVKIAHAQLAAQIEPLLKLSDKPLHCTSVKGADDAAS